MTVNDRSSEMRFVSATGKQYIHTSGFSKANERSSERKCVHRRPKMLKHIVKNAGILVHRRESKSEPTVVNDETKMGVKISFLGGFDGWVQCILTEKPLMF